LRDPGEDSFLGGTLAKMWAGNFSWDGSRQEKLPPWQEKGFLGGSRWDPARIQASISNASQGSFKVVFKYRVFVIYPQTVQAQYVTVDSMGDSRKYPYPTTLGINILTSPCLWKFQNVLPHLPPCPPNSKIINLSSSPLEFPIFFRPFGIPV